MRFLSEIASALSYSQINSYCSLVTSSHSLRWAMRRCCVLQRNWKHFSLKNQTPFLSPSTAKHHFLVFISENVKENSHCCRNETGLSQMSDIIWRGNVFVKRGKKYFFDMT